MAKSGQAIREISATRTEEMRGLGLEHFPPRGSELNPLASLVHLVNLDF